VSDGDIFDAATRLDETVILVTKDADFIDLLHHRGPPPVIVWLRTGNVTNRDLRRILSAAWARTSELILGGEALVEIIREAGSMRDEDG
jgi:predicted nuclease of predicted toxin-antitoxin system